MAVAKAVVVVVWFGACTSRLSWLALREPDTELPELFLLRRADAIVQRVASSRGPRCAGGGRFALRSGGLFLQRGGGAPARRRF